MGTEASALTLIRRTNPLGELTALRAAARPVDDSLVTSRVATTALEDQPLDPDGPSVARVARAPRPSGALRKSVPADMDGT